MDALREVEGRIFDKKFEWESIDKAQALENKRVLDLIREACLIEAYFGIYVANMISLLKEDLEATSMFTIEGFEAYSHYYILRKYLDIINYKPIKDEEILAIREKDKDVKYDDEIKELVNFMATEHFAANFFKDLSDLAPEPILKKILATLSKDEVMHSRFAFDLLRKRLNKNPEIKDKILSDAKKFQHIGAYVLPTVSNAKEDNIKIIQSFNNILKDLVGESISDYSLRKKN
ncbi:MAG: hypothetical protein QW727_00155 [Candidatus Pacearchaeota archaeon]